MLVRYSYLANSKNDNRCKSSRLHYSSAGIGSRLIFFYFCRKSNFLPKKVGLSVFAKYILPQNRLSCSQNTFYPKIDYRKKKKKNLNLWSLKPEHSASKNNFGWRPPMAPASQKSCSFGRMLLCIRDALSTLFYTYS